jgi:hypothetical protein
MKIRFHSLVAALGFLSFVTFTHGGPRLTPTLDTKLEGTNSVVYCPTLQIAWADLERIVGGPIEMQKQDDLLRRLNDASCPTDVVPEDAHVAMAGFTDQGIVPKIEEALRKTFGASAPRLPPILSNKRTVIVTYSYLFRTLPFPKQFARSTTIPLDFRSGKGSLPVEFFGAPQRTADDFASQVNILHYSGEDDFVVLLSSRVKDEFVVLAKVQQPDTLSSGVATVQKQLEAERKGFTKLEVGGKTEFYLNTLSHGDILAIPVVDLNVATNYPQLCDSLFKNPGFEEVWLHQVYQGVAFRMDEAGATVRSTAYGAAFGGGSSKPRRFLFDRPFLLTLWKQNAKQPYLAVWIASSDVLIPFKKENGKAQTSAP